MTGSRLFLVWVRVSTELESWKMTGSRLFLVRVSTVLMLSVTVSSGGVAWCRAEVRVRGASTDTSSDSAEDWRTGSWVEARMFSGAGMASVSKSGLELGEQPLEADLLIVYLLQDVFIINDA